MILTKNNDAVVLKITKIKFRVKKEFKALLLKVRKQLKKINY